MEVDKYDLDGGIRAMRLVVQLLTTWADDLEASARSGKFVYTAGPPAKQVPPAEPVPGSYPAPDAPDAATAAAPASASVPVSAADAAPAPSADAAQVPAPPPEAVPAAPEAPAPEPAPSPPPAPPTYDEVLSVMSRLCAAGLSPQVHELIVSYGAVCLSEVPKEKYGELLAAGYRLAAEGKVDLTTGDADG